MNTGTPRRGSLRASPWGLPAAGLAVGAFAIASVLGILIAGVILYVAGAEGSNGFAVLVTQLFAAAVSLAVVRYLGRRGSAGLCEQVGLLPLAPASLARLLAPAMVGLALVVLAWGLVVDLGAALPLPRAVSGNQAADEVFGRASTSVGLGASSLFGLLGLAVVAPVAVEILLRGVALPALVAWRGGLLAAVLVSGLGVLAGVPAVIGSGLLLCVLVLQGVLCVLRLLSGSIVPGVLLSTAVSGTATAAAYGWSFPGVLLTGISCGAAGYAIVASAPRLLGEAG